MQLIIFGTKVKTRAVGEGEFFCPSCQKTRKYTRLKGKNYFALYFVPLIPMGDTGEIIECQHCKRSYNPEVLEKKLSKPQPDVAQLLNNVRTRLTQGYPVEYMIRDLTSGGMDLDVARNTVQLTIGEGRAFCPNCELSYAADVSKCTDCGTALEVQSS